MADAQQANQIKQSLHAPHVHASVGVDAADEKARRPTREADDKTPETPQKHVQQHLAVKPMPEASGSLSVHGHRSEDTSGKLNSTDVQPINPLEKRLRGAHDQASVGIDVADEPARRSTRKIDDDTSTESKK